MIKPADFDVNKKYPGILEIHGGPKGTFGPVINHEMQVFAANGYFVFYCNPAAPIPAAMPLRISAAVSAKRITVI